MIGRETPFTNNHHQNNTPHTRRTIGRETPFTNNQHQHNTPQTNTPTLVQCSPVTNTGYTQHQQKSDSPPPQQHKNTQHQHIKTTTRTTIARESKNLHESNTNQHTQNLHQRYNAPGLMFHYRETFADTHCLKPLPTHKHKHKHANDDS
jgi:hypothetical protein